MQCYWVSGKRRPFKAAGWASHASARVLLHLMHCPHLSASAAPALLPMPPPCPAHPMPSRLQAFNRSTTKYWVRTSDVSTVKRIIIENMPVFVFNKVRRQGCLLVVRALRGQLAATPSAPRAGASGWDCR